MGPVVVGWANLGYHLEGSSEFHIYIYIHSVNVSICKFILKYIYIYIDIDKKRFRAMIFAKACESWTIFISKNFP